MTQKNYITVFVGKNEPQSYNLDSFGTELVRLGRGPYHGNQEEKNDIEIASDVRTISRAHCTFSKRADGWYVRDDQSKNGLLFNDVRITFQKIHDGDKFYIGKDVNTRCVIAVSSQRSGSEDLIDKVALNGRDKFILGRYSDCDVVLRHPSVSRYHGIISFENGSYYIADNDSMNGISLNGRLLHKKEKLEQMDKIAIADISMVFCDDFLYFNKNIRGVSVVSHEATKEVQSGKGKKCILNCVSLSIEPGEFVAILGGSGAGKTTLLNCLSGMADFTSGDILINGESIKSNLRGLKGIIGYVPQRDIVYDNLTLEHMLYYSAQLRMPKDTARDEIEKEIEETLEIVELSNHRKTLISKLSGGQKKRASIAVELLASPKLFFLDEPSSGLDPGTEKKLMGMLKKLTFTGKTVIMVTHTVQNVDMCDKLICMGNGGRLCFAGMPQDALAFFGCGQMADIYEDLNEHSEEVSKRFSSMIASRNIESKPETEKNRDKKGRRPCIGSGIRQFAVMTRRYVRLTGNNRLRLLMLFLMPVALTILVCAAFQADGNLYNYLGISVNRTSLPFLVGGDTMRLMFTFACAAFWVGIFNSVQEISKERAVYEREQFTGIRPLPYVMSKVTVISLLCLAQTVIMVCLLTYFTSTTATVDGNMASVTALKLEMNESGIIFGSLWPELFITTFLTLLSAMCLGLAVSSAVSNEMALVICPVCLLPQILFSGVACTLSGFTEKISGIITCRWACIAYLTTARVNEMYESCKFDVGSWTKKAFENGFGIDEAYSASRIYLLGMNPVLSAWTALLFLSAACVAISVFLLHVKERKK